MTRLEHLLTLRDRIDAEITAERGRLARIANLRARLAADIGEEPEDELIPPSTAPASTIRRWLSAHGYDAPGAGPLTHDLRRLYAAAGEPYGNTDPRPTSAEIRAWAEANGIAVNRTGAVTSQVRDAYLAAQAEDVAS